ncbi:DUF721 domain-containing protein [Parazoarcus communis]|uniref:DUF721 domain-containing protein n=1 Tax=Parazoarcus communis SWub3 = DSM 12120 TaxID=1121029 RepID=A0A323UZY8_9RHOO|nr:DUF721 domain-containing protein [Parazoarcus communis]NMG70140.1 DUF721 domain-containing protein [Parazoarcus communis SWub3 = DSM 12120]PZA18312.1 DUF721 domain-containing protein [Azoarcus communis] [Parazoarcus communis SWub3 = DSM 12120]
MSTLIQRFLGSGDMLARLQDHAARLRRLQGLLEQALPPQFVGACSIANLKDDTLVIAARGGAIAVRLKQMAPSLLDHFLRAGYPLSSIKIKVATPEQHVPARAPSNRSMSPSARDTLTDFAATLPADSPLRDSLERLARRSRER